MQTRDGKKVNCGDRVWDITNPFQPVKIDNVSYVGEDEPATIDVEAEGKICSRNVDELFFCKKECLLAARKVEYDKFRMYEEFIERVRKNIDLINEELDKPNE